MIRFIDITEEYWVDGGAPCCLFINTVNDQCLVNDAGSHVFDSLVEVKSIPQYGERCAHLLPAGFFGTPEEAQDGKA